MPDVPQPTDGISIANPAWAGKGNDSAALRPALCLRNALHTRHTVVNDGLIAHRCAAIAPTPHMNAWLAVQRIDLHTSVVGHHHHMWHLGTIRFRLESGSCFGQV